LTAFAQTFAAACSTNPNCLSPPAQGESRWARNFKVSCPPCPPCSLASRTFRRPQRARSPDLICNQIWRATRAPPSPFSLSRPPLPAHSLPLTTHSGTRLLRLTALRPLVATSSRPPFALSSLTETGRGLLHRRLRKRGEFAGTRFLTTSKFAGGRVKSNSFVPLSSRRRRRRRKRRRSKKSFICD